MRRRLLSCSHKLLRFRNPRLPADGGSTLEDERQLLVEEQKLCKVRARKFSLETKRRRKALEERRKLWDVQEQRLRENVLQQRRQRVQDATERFQRAHLPLSQRQRQSFRRNIPNIEDALNQIQGSLSSHSQLNFHISRCATSPKPPTVPKSSIRQSLSAVEAYTKLLQEHSTQETEKMQEEQQDHNLRESQMSDSCNSESLSSKDSLEIEDLHPRTEALRSPSSSFLVDSEKSHQVVRTQNDLYPTTDHIFSAMMLLSDNLVQATKLHEPKQEEHEQSEGRGDKIYVSKSSWDFTSEQTPKTATRSSLHNCNILTFCELISGDSEHFEANTGQADNIIATNRATPSSTAPGTSCPNQEALLDLRQQKANDDRQLKHPSATEILLPAKNGNSNDILFGSSPKPNIFLKDNAVYNVSHEGAAQQTGKENHYLSSQKEPGASINNLNKASASVSKPEKPVTVLLQHACLSNIQSDTLKCLECHEEDIRKVPVRFIKGILKKHSKYIPGDAACVYGSGHLVFAEQVALQIRDSIELTRAKAKHVDANKTVKKKLRWLDEVHVENEDKEENAMSQPTSALPRSRSSSEDHQLSVATASGASGGPVVTPAASPGYHFTKHAWADVGVQVSLPQEQADEVPRSSTRTPKVPRRERSTRAGVGPVSSRTRKGTVIRPQSATEVSQITRTQGKLMVPRPPPRVEEKMAHTTKAPYGSDGAGVSCKRANAVDQNSEGLLSPCVHHGGRTDSGVVYTALPPSSEGGAKDASSSGQQETHGSSAIVFGEKGLCLKCTPTDEEISQLWHGVRSALASKEAKAVLGRQALESGRAVRKPCVEHSRNPPASGSRRLPQPSQPMKATPDPVRLFSSIYDVFPHEALRSAAHLRAHAGFEERNVVAVETAQTQRSGPVQHRLTTVSLEEQRILLSLDRLNHRLHCVQEHVGGNRGTCDLVLIDPHSTKDVKISPHQKHSASSASGRARFQKKV
ncbi:centrosomal protein of 126 kDa isoform X2 [Betta splendens]|uniref:Centrosomal protein of 126 kDa isoform X2 n=1 Tax=Betta splendens TaxID=158456 RepID=A0A6P7PBG0_BETSP|nr:centrosomal protein of 126 kDa isoform X2 [Betta splendens]